MGLKERAQIGELTRRNALLQDQLARAQARTAEFEREVQRHAALEQESVELRAASATTDALAKENERLAASLADTRKIIDQLRAQLKHADHEVSRLRAILQYPDRSPEEKILDFIKSSNNISAAAREHLQALFDLARQEYHGGALWLQKPLVALIGAYSRKWKQPPATCHDLAKSLHTESSFFNWASRRSPLVSVAGRDDKNQVLYSLNLDLLGCEDLPPLPGRAPWFHRSSG